jgi:superfamily II DNA helicase RecQ
MAHTMDVFRGMKHSKIISLGHDQTPMYGKGKAWKKQDTERLFRLLMIKGIIMEKCEINGMGFPVSHIRVW